MKKILVCLIAIVVVMNLSAQVEGTIQWRPEIDFTYHVNGEYVEISSETGYVVNRECLRSILCENISYTCEYSASNTDKVCK